MEVQILEVDLEAELGVRLVVGLRADRRVGLGVKLPKQAQEKVVEPAKLAPKPQIWREKRRAPPSEGRLSIETKIRTKGLGSRQKTSTWENESRNSSELLVRTKIKTRQ